MSEEPETKWANEITGKTTRPFANLYPTECGVRDTNDYSSLKIDLNENDPSVVLDFGTDYGSPPDTGAAVRFDVRDLRLLIVVLQAALRELEQIENEP